MQHLDLGPNEDIPLTRYLNWEKFEDLMQRHALYLHRIDCFENDKNDGKLARFSKLLVVTPDDPIGKPLLPDKSHEELRKLSFVSSWRMEDTESKDMWDEYADTDRSIMIKSSYKKLVSSLDESDIRHIYIAPAKYDDNFSTLLPMYARLLTKGKCYADEKEMRVLVCPFNATTEDKKGMHVSVDLDKLIVSVITSPKSNNIFLAEVQTFLRSKGLDKQVYRSSY